MWGWWAGDGFNAKPALTIVGVKALAEFGKKKKKNNGENSGPLNVIVSISPKRQPTTYAQFQICLN